VVGRATAIRLQEHGFIADHQPDQFSAEALVEKLVQSEVMKKARILFPGADIARKTIVDGLTAYGAEVLPVTVYRTVTVETLPDEIISMLEQKMIHLVTFASSSTVRAFTRTLGEHGVTRLEGVTIACIGPVTRSTAREAGFFVDIMPEEASITALIDAIVQYRHHS
jgi:uroporphyrinogen III methyltransferase/synthase